LRYLNAHGKALAYLIVMMMLRMHYTIANHMPHRRCRYPTFTAILLRFSVGTNVDRAAVSKVFQSYKLE
jgi:hypothetical protein